MHDTFRPGLHFGNTSVIGAQNYISDVQIVQVVHIYIILFFYVGNYGP